MSKSSSSFNFTSSSCWFSLTIDIMSKSSSSFNLTSSSCWFSLRCSLCERSHPGHPARPVPRPAHTVSTTTARHQRPGRPLVLHQGQRVPVVLGPRPLPARHPERHEGEGIQTYYTPGTYRCSRGSYYT